MASRRIKFNGFASGSSVAIAAALASGPSDSGSTSTWGTTTAGTITIDTRRSNLQVAPDSVLFTVDLSAATFDTTAQWEIPAGVTPLGDNPGSAGTQAHPAYDARMHDLLYFWDLGETRTWDKPPHVLTHWRNARYQYGPFVKHMYQTPGTYTVNLTVIEPSSGKTATATAEVVVKDVTVEVADADKYYVYPTGGSAGSIPAGANSVEFSNFFTTFRSVDTSNPTMWVFQRGGSYAMTERLEIWESGRSGEFYSPDPYFGAYGDEADPIPVVTWTSGSALSFPRFSRQLVSAGTTDPQDIRFTDWHFDGSFEPPTGDWGVPEGASPSGVADQMLGNGEDADYRTDLYVMWNNCVFEGFYDTVWNLQDITYGTDHWHWDSCQFKDLRGGAYPFLVAVRYNDDAAMGLTGCDLVFSDYIPADSEISDSTLRQTCHPYLYVTCNDFFTPATRNACVKFENGQQDNRLIDFSSEAAAEASGSWVHGNAANITRNTFEGQVTLLTIARTNKHGGGASNFILDTNILIAGPETTNFIETGLQGITIRNNFMWVPPTAARNNPFDNFIECSRFTYANDDSAYFVTDTLDDTGLSHTWYTRPFPGMAPNRIYNNTMICERSLADNQSVTPTTIVANVDATGGLNTSFPTTEFYNTWYVSLEAVFEENNLVVLPGGSTTGLDASTFLPFSPHFRGPTLWDNGTKTIDTSGWGGTYDMTGLNIATFAKSSGVGSSITDITAPSVPLGEDWSYSDPGASAYDGDARPEGAWLSGATPS